MENKIDLRNRYIGKIQQKLNDLQSCVNTLSEIDTAILSQTGGAVSGSAESKTPDGTNPSENQVNVSQLQNKAQVLLQSGDLKEEIKNKTSQINENIKAINDGLQAVLTKLNELKLPTKEDINNIPVPKLA